MHRLFPIAGALLALSLISAAPRAAGADTALGNSDWSLEIGTDLGAGSTDGSFAIRRHSSASNAFRFAVEVGFDESDGDGTRIETGNPDIDLERSSSFSATALSIQWMHFAPIRDNVTASFAVGPVVEMQRETFRQDFNVGTPGFSSVEERFTSTTYGLDLGFGVEWFFNRRMSLGGQTGLRVTTGSGKDVQLERTVTELFEQVIETDETEIDLGTARLQLTAYF